MGEATTGSDLFNELANEFAERYRLGERPPLTEYTLRYPDLADEIRELFPALVMMEEFGSGAGSVASRPLAGLGKESAAPERLGDYRILREIGRGGMGVVYEAVQESLGRHVALKVLLQNRRLRPTELLRFQREAKAAAQLHHNNIVPVFGVGEHEGTNFYAMQYIQGQGLDSVLSEIIRVRKDPEHVTVVDQRNADGLTFGVATGLLTDRFSARLSPASTDPLASPSPGLQSPDRATIVRTERLTGRLSSSSVITERSETRYFRGIARLGVQAASALAYAHSRGVLHRDIKPSNLLLDLDGRIWVTDFGLAKAQGADELTSPGDIIGTLRYMAPERFQGKDDPRGDVYSLGVTLYELLTLKPAFTALHRPQLIHTILHEDPIPPRKIDPQIPRDLETIVLKAIERDLNKRFADAAEMASELERFVERRPIRSRPVSPPERLWRWCVRNPVIAFLSVVALALVCALAVGSTVAAFNFRVQRNAVVAAQGKTQANLTRALTAERDRRAELGRSLLAQARAERYSGRPGRRFGGLETLRRAVEIASDVGAPAEHLADLGDEAIATVVLLDARPTRQWPELPSTFALASIDAESNRYALLSNRREVEFHNLSDGALIATMGFEPQIERDFLGILPGGRFAWVCVMKAHGFELWDSEKKQIPVGWPRDVACVAPSGDGRVLAVLRAGGELRVYDLPGMNERSRSRVGVTNRDLQVPQRMGISSDGRLVALSGDNNRTIYFFDPATGATIKSFMSIRPNREIELAQSGKLLAIPHERTISVHEVPSGKLMALLDAHQEGEVFARFSHNGDLLASSAKDGTTRLWDPYRGRLLLTIRGALDGWDADGSGLRIRVDDTLTRHELVFGSARRTIDCKRFDNFTDSEQANPGRIAFSPDGQLLVIAGRADGVRIVRVSDGAVLAHLQIGDTDQALFLADGSLVTYNWRGLLWWPAARLANNALRLGPPEPLALPRDNHGIHGGLAAEPSGKLVGASYAFADRTVVLDPRRPWKRTWMHSNVFVADMDLSPDGKWVATAGIGQSWDTVQLRVADAKTGRTLVELPTGGARVAFSPDGRWLGAGGDGCYRFYRTGTWQPTSVVAFGSSSERLPLAFHPTGRVAATIAITRDRSVVRLVDVENGKILATLESPAETTNPTRLTFSPSGQSLAVARSDGLVELWDLALIRKELERELHLESHLPDIFNGNGHAEKKPVAERVELMGADPDALRSLWPRQTLRRAWIEIRQLFDLGLTDAEDLYIRGYHFTLAKQWRAARADLRACLAQNPDHYMAAGTLAWSYLFDSAYADAQEGLRWAQNALALRPNDPVYRQYIAMGYYRTGRYTEAAAMFDAGTRDNTEIPVYDYLFLAMCRHRAGDPKGAQAALEAAKAWRKRNPAWSYHERWVYGETLRETEETLRSPIRTLPANVFAH
jgi:serine/threonine protein kinase/WD40 repeat protein